MRRNRGFAVLAFLVPLIAAGVGWKIGIESTRDDEDRLRMIRMTYIVHVPEDIQFEVEQACGFEYGSFVPYWKLKEALEESHEDQGIESKCVEVFAQTIKEHMPWYYRWGLV